MDNNTINDTGRENNSVISEDYEYQMPGSNLQPSGNDNNNQQAGFSFKWKNLLWGIAIFIGLFGASNLFTGNWSLYLYFAIVVVIHELGHVIVGTSFGCHVKEVQIFLFKFLSYMPKQNSEGSKLRNIKWSLGILPLGGLTVFKTRASDAKYNKGTFTDDIYHIDYALSRSPYIGDKPAWQRLLISAAGVLLNTLTFLIIYLLCFRFQILSPYISDAFYDVLWSLMIFSLALAILNILPVYPLDGGVILFTLYEMITGKKTSQMFTNICTFIGFIFIVLFFWIFPEWLDGIMKKIINLLFSY